MPNDKNNVQEPKKKESLATLGDILYKGLNEQGFLFQEKCCDTIDNKSKITNWHVHTTEHPVSLKDRDTRIDIIILETNGDKFGIIECKKVNPNYHCWLFGKPLFDKPIHAPAQIIQLSFKKKNDFKVVQIKRDFEIDTHVISNWWMQVNIDPNKKPNKYSDPEPIEDALIQACLGVGGLIEERIRQIAKIIKDGDTDFFDLQPTYFIPIVVTTAFLFTSEYELSDVDISSGTIEKSKTNFDRLIDSSKSVNWVLVDFGAPNKTIPDLLFNNVHGVDPVDLEPYNRRSVFIVNSKHLIDLLTHLHFF